MDRGRRRAFKPQGQNELKHTPALASRFAQLLAGHAMAGSALQGRGGTECTQKRSARYGGRFSVRGVSGETQEEEKLYTNEGRGIASRWRFRYRKVGGDFGDGLTLGDSKPWALNFLASNSSPLHRQQGGTDAWLPLVSLCNSQSCSYSLATTSECIHIHLPHRLLLPEVHNSKQEAKKQR